MTEEKTLAELHWEKLLQSNDFEQAEHFYDSTKKNGQLTVEMCYVMGLWHHQRENYKKAADAYLDGLELMPTGGELYFALGNTLREVGNDEEALRHYNNALLFYPNFIDAHFCKGQVLANLEQEEEALACFCKAMSLSTRSEERIAIAVEVSMLEKADLAIELYFYALIYDSENPYLYSNLGVEFAEQEEYDSALFCHRKAIALNEMDGDVWYNAACTFAMVNESLQSLVALEKAIQLDPNNKTYAATDPELEGLHNLKRFWKLVE